MGDNEHDYQPDHQPTEHQHQFENQPAEELTRPVYAGEATTEEFDPITGEPVVTSASETIPATSQTSLPDDHSYNEAKPSQPLPGGAPESGPTSTTHAPASFAAVAPDSLIPGAEPVGSTHPDVAVKDDERANLSMLELIDQELLADFERALYTVRRSSAAEVPGTIMHAAGNTLEKATIRLRAALARERQGSQPSEPSEHHD